MIEGRVYEKYGLNWLSISVRLRVQQFFFFPFWQSAGIKNSEMCPWLLGGDGDPGHTWNKARAKSITMSFTRG